MKRVLYLTHHFPWPPRCGGRIREAMLLKRLSRDFAIDLVAVSEEYRRDASALRSIMPPGINVNLFRAEGSSNPLLGPYSRRYHSRSAGRHLADSLASLRYDMVHVEGHFLLPMVPPQFRSRVLLVEHNVESSLFAQQAATAESWLRQKMAALQAALTRRDEMSAWKQVASLAMVTEHDAELVRSRLAGKLVHVTPNGFDHLNGNSAGTGSGRAEFDLVMVGNYRYQPSEDAAIRLLTRIYPLIRKELPGTTLALVGKSPSAALRQIAAAYEHVTVTGEVDDVREWLDGAKVFVAPLRVGGGVKVKIVEALARGRAVVTTRVGVQGLEHITPGAIAVHDDDQTLAGECVHLLCAPGEREDREAKARAAVTRLLTWDDAADQMARRWWAITPAGLAVAHS